MRREAKSTCVSKERFESLDVAQAVADLYVRDIGVRNKVYKCSTCLRYHLAHINKHQYGRAVKKIREQIAESKFNYHWTKHVRPKR
jgi:hypothetical protein